MPSPYLLSRAQAARPRVKEPLEKIVNVSWAGTGGRDRRRLNHSLAAHPIPPNELT